MSLVSDVWSAVLVWVRGSDTSAMGGGGGASSVGVVASSEGVLGLPLATAEWACEALGVNTDVPQVRPLSLSIHNRIIPLAYPAGQHDTTWPPSHAEFRSHSGTVALTDAGTACSNARSTNRPLHTAVFTRDVVLTT
jgi:hypothetical protein